MNIELRGNYFLNRLQSEKYRGFSASELFGRLRDILHKAGYPSKGQFAFGDVVDDDCLLMCEDGEFWVVAYVERGVRFAPAFFCDVDDAVQFFLWKLTGGEISLVDLN